MTLSTDIYVHGTGVTQREVYEKVNDLLGIPAEREVIDGPNEWDWQQGDYRLSNRIGQGFPAIVDTYANADGSEVVPSHADDCEPGCDYHRCTAPPWHVHVDLDTAYGYRDERGWECAQLHGWVIAALIDWLAERGCTLHWVDEYAGTLHEGTDHLNTFLGAWRRGRRVVRHQGAAGDSGRGDRPMTATPAIYTGANDTTEFLLEVHDDGRHVLATRPIGADPWVMWSRQVLMRPADLPAAATRTQPGRCPCGADNCSDAAVRR